MVVFSHTILTPGRAEADAKAIIGHRRRHGSPTVVLSPGGLGDAIEGLYQENGVPVFRDTATAFDSLKCHYASVASSTAGHRLEAPTLASGSKSALEQSLHAVQGKASRILSELDSARLLRAVGVPVVESRHAESFEQMKSIAGELGYPVVLKALAPDVAHKNRLGFVIPNIPDAASLQRSRRELQERIALQNFAPEDVQIIVQPMLRSSAELIVGVTRDSVLGYFLVMGLGGVYTEVLDRSIMIPMPFAPSLARQWVEGTQIGKLVQSVDPSGRLMDEVLDITHALQALIMNSGDLIEEIDINPLLIGPWGCKAVDALVVLAGADRIPAPADTEIPVKIPVTRGQA
jgi:acyl-CoA synthetase (NDP forming)